MTQRRRHGRERAKRNGECVREREKKREEEREWESKKWS
jgi:hypothetical protein